MEFIESLEYFTSCWWPYTISFLISLIVTIRIFMSGPKCLCNNRIDDKIILITDPMSGLGYELANILASRGGRIILACRNAAIGQIVVNQIKNEVPDAQLDLRILDISVLANIPEFVNKISKNYHRIDILINNANIINQSMEMTKEDFDVTLSTNYLGPFLLTHRLLPLLKNSDNGRIINISVSTHYTAGIKASDLKKGYHSKDLFEQTKIAIILFTKYLARLTKEYNITVNAVSPGLVQDTNHFKSLEMDESLFAKICFLTFKWLFIRTPNEGCQTILYAALDPGLTKVTGKYISDCEIKEPANITKEEILTREIYNTTCFLCGLDRDYVTKTLS